MQNVFTAFERNMAMIKAHDTILYEHDYESTSFRSLMSTFVESEGAAENAARFVRFCNDWNGKYDVSLTIFSHVVKNGWWHLFKAFYQADNSWFWNGEASHEYIKVSIVYRFS